MKSKDPLVSIIIVNYNGRRFLKECFGSLEHISYPNYEILFVDNASTAGSIENIYQKFTDKFLIIARKLKELFLHGLKRATIAPDGIQRWII